MRLLIAVDMSDSAQAVLNYAAELAAFGPELLLLHVVDADPEFVGTRIGPVSVRKARARELCSRRAMISRSIAELRQQGVRATGRVRCGSIPETIAAVASTCRASGVVLGSHGHGLAYHAVVGSVTQSVLRLLRVPVTVVPTFPGRVQPL